MAKAYKCDRCGRLYEPYEFRDYNEKIMFKEYIVNVCTLGGSPFDLCPDCRIGLVEYMNRYDNGKD